MQRLLQRHALACYSNQTAGEEEVFTHHAQALGAEDLDAMMMDIAATATFISPSGVLRGKDAIRQFFADLLQMLPKAQWGVKTIYADNVPFLE